MKISIHQPEFLPWIGFFNKMVNCDVFVLLDNVQFRKNYFQNRNRIRTKEGWIWLTVPILDRGHFQLINEVKIANNLPWSKKQLKSISTNYHRAPFFQSYFPILESVYDNKWEKLVDLNIKLIESLKKNLKIKTEIKISSHIINKSDLKGSKFLLYICKSLEADVYLSGKFGKTYLNEESFSRKGIKVEYQDFKHPIYKQLYTPFLPEMSIIDLLFNEGPKSLEFIKGGL